MKLRNKQTGEIGYTAVLRSKAIVVMDENAIQLGSYTSLTELNKDWEDYEEPKGTQCIYYVNHFDAAKIDGVIIGFNTKEEAKLAVRKLKAWKRLKDKGFRFVEGWLDNNDDDFIIKAKLGHVGLIDQPDVSLLFGGKK